MAHGVRYLALFAALALLPSPGAATELVPRGADWRYLDDGSDQMTAWRDPGFVDASWAIGPAQLGYGDADEDTIVASGLPNPQNERHITTYFRHTFQVPDPGALQGLTLKLLRDDGAVVYLNGVEVYRTDMPVGPIDYLTLASTTIGGPAEDQLLEVALDPADIDPGSNLLAVEIHQVSATNSSDISFDLELLTGPTVIVRSPYLQVGRPDAVVVRWRTDLPTDSRVSYGPAPNELTDTVTVPGARIEHEVELTGLAPQDLYYYDVGATALVLAGGDLDHSFRTSPVPGNQQLARIWVIGDSGECARSQQGCNDAIAVADAYLAFAAGRLADVWLMLGDNAYFFGIGQPSTRSPRCSTRSRGRSCANTVLWPSPSATMTPHSCRLCRLRPGVYFDILRSSQRRGSPEESPPVRRPTTPSTTATSTSSRSIHRTPIGAHLRTRRPTSVPQPRAAPCTSGCARTCRTPTATG